MASGTRTVRRRFFGALSCDSPLIATPVAEGNGKGRERHGGKARCPKLTRPVPGASDGIGGDACGTACCAGRLLLSGRVTERGAGCQCRGLTMPGGDLALARPGREWAASGRVNIRDPATGIPEVRLDCHSGPKCVIYFLDSRPGMHLPAGRKTGPSAGDRKDPNHPLRKTLGGRP